MSRSLCFGAAALLLVPTHAPAEEFVLREGDRVALVGSTLIEREQLYGYWEAALTARFPGVTFRNVGWSGDTVWGESRVGFDLDRPEKGFERLRDAVLAVKPTVIIVGYGTNESFAGPAGLPRFKEGLTKLLDAFAPTKARVVLLSPVKMASDFKKQNEHLGLYGNAIKEIAKQRDNRFIDLLNLKAGGARMTIGLAGDAEYDSGQQLSDFGYWRYTQAIEEGLGLDRPGWIIGIDLSTKKAQAPQAKVDKLEVDPVRFRVTDLLLPACWCEDPAGGGPYRVFHHPLQGPVLINNRILIVRDLAPGKYVLKIDGKEIYDDRAHELDKPGRLMISALVDRGPEFDQAEQLRQTIIEKNRLFFHRFRPQNETYLFGFRKYEQGKNAVEVPQFDPLIAKLEAKIAELRKPKPHVYEIVEVKK